MQDHSGGLSRFAAQHGTTLVRFAYLLCGDRGTAEDLVQTAYLSLFRRFGDDLPIEAPVAYARRVIVNAHTSRIRRRAGTELVVADVPDTADADAVDHGEQDAMWRALRGLSERQRTVLVCRYYLGHSDAQIAELLDVRIGTVRSLAARGFAALRTRSDLTSRSVNR